MEEHERRDDDGDHGPDAEAHFAQSQANELVEHATHAPREAAHVADGDPEPLSRTLLLADGAHRRKARRAQQVEGAEGDDRSGRPTEHLSKAVPQLRVRLAEVAELGDDADGRDDVLLRNEAGDGGCGGLPVREAKRREDPGQQVAEASHEAVLHVVGRLGVKQAEAFARIAEVHEEPDDDRGQEDDGTCFDDVALHALPHREQDVLHARHMVLRKLHDERRGLAGEELGLFQHDAGDDNRDDAHEVEHRGDIPGGVGVARGNRAEHEGNDRHLRTAGNHGGGHDRHATILLVLDGLSCHDGGHAAAGGDEHRDEGFAGQAELAEDAVHDERNAGHVTAQLQEAKEQEEDHHLRDEADNGTNTCDDAVHDERLEPRGNVGRLKGVTDDGAETRDPQAPRAIGGVGLFDFEGSLVIGEGDRLLLDLAVVAFDFHRGNSMLGLGLLVERRNRCLSIVVLGNGVFVLGHSIDVSGVFGSLGLGQGKRIKHFLGVVGGKAGHLVLAEDVLDVGGNLRLGVFVLGRGLVERLAAGVEPAVAGDAVVSPVGHNAAADRDGQPVHEEHDDDEDRQAEEAVRDDTVNLLGSGHALGRLLHRVVDDAGDLVVAGRGDDGFRIIVELGLERITDGVDRFLVGVRQLELGNRAFLALERLDGEPTGRRRGDLRAEDVDDLRERRLDLVGEANLRRGGNALLPELDRGLHKLVHAAALERRGGNDRAAELARELVDVDRVAVLLDEVHHVEGDDHRQAQFENLRGQIQVALQVGRVDQVDNDVRVAIEKIVARDDFLRRIRRERIDAGKVGNRDILVLGVLAFLLFNSNARPVANVLVGAGQVVEHGRLAAVRVAGKRNANSHDLPFQNQRCLPLLLRRNGGTLKGWCGRFDKLDSTNRQAKKKACEGPARTKERARFRLRSCAAKAHSRER